MSVRPVAPVSRSADASLALGAVLWRAHERARALRLTLELEAADPRVAALEAAARDLQRRIGRLIVEVATELAEVPA